MPFAKQYPTEDAATIAEETVEQQQKYIQDHCGGHGILRHAELI